MKTKSPQTQIAGFIAKFTPEIAALTKTLLAKMRKRLPHAVEMVYDNYNFLVFGFGPTERPSEAIFSIAAHARGVALCFLHGAKLPDPKKSFAARASRSAISSSPPPPRSTSPPSAP